MSNYSSIYIVTVHSVTGSIPRYALHPAGQTQLYYSKIHHDTKFAEEPAGSVDLTLFLLSVIRIMLPQVLLPATTALGTLDPRGREKGFQSGANVVMPNLSPVKNRKQYELYDNKICTGEEAAECRGCLSRRVESVGYEIVTDRGDSPMMA